MKILKENFYLISLIVLLTVCLSVSVGHYANILIDVGREMYYPVEILNGKVLYKDLFCIYGPMSYLVNSLLFKLFGAKLSTLYFAGSINAIFIISFIYLIAKKFLSKFTSFSIALFLISTGCLATRIFNFTIPYSYAMVYGLASMLISLYFLLGFIEDNKPSKLYLASLFAGFATVNKYDFILYIIPVLIVNLRTKNLKLILKSGAFYLISCLIPFVVLFIEGLNFQELSNSILIVKGLTETTSLKVFYSTQGVFYNYHVWEVWAFEFLSNIVFYFFIYFGFTLFSKEKKGFKTSGLFLIAIGVFGIYVFVRSTSYLYLTFLTFVFFILTAKKNSYKQNVFILSALIISLKSLWGLSHVNYGLYYVALIFIAFFILCKKYTSLNFQKTILVILLTMTLSFGIYNFQWLKNTDTKINTNKGKLYTIKEFAIGINQVIDFINKVEDKNPYVMIFPEGLTVNFLTEKNTKTDGIYNSLIPLYVESFGENNIIEHYRKNPPDYIIMYDMEMKSYKQGAIGKDYGLVFHGFILNNYELVKKIEKIKESEAANEFLIYKRRK